MEYETKFFSQDNGFLSARNRQAQQHTEKCSLRTINLISGFFGSSTAWWQASTLNGASSRWLPSRMTKASQRWNRSIISNRDFRRTIFLLWSMDKSAEKVTRWGELKGCKLENSQAPKILNFPRDFLTRTIMFYEKGKSGWIARGSIQQWRKTLGSILLQRAI